MIRRNGLVIAMTVLLIGAVVSPAQAANKSGGACKTTNAKATIGGKKYTYYKPTTKFVGGYTTQGQYITTGGVAKNNHLPTPPMFRRHPFNENPLCPTPEIGSTRGLPPRNVFLFNVAIDIYIYLFFVLYVY